MAKYNFKVIDSVKIDSTVKYTEVNSSIEKVPQVIKDATLPICILIGSVCITIYVLEILFMYVKKTIKHWLNQLYG